MSDHDLRPFPVATPDCCQPGALTHHPSRFNKSSSRRKRLRMSTQKVTRLLGEPTVVYSDESWRGESADKAISSEPVDDHTALESIMATYEDLPTQPHLKPLAKQSASSPRRPLPVLKLDIDRALRRLHHIQVLRTPLLPTDSENESNSSPSLSPMTPDPVSPLSADIVKVRRTKMTKLVRTLGEPVPSQLITGPVVNSFKPLPPTDEAAVTYVTPPRRTQSLRASDSIWQDKTLALPSFPNGAKYRARLRNSTSMVEMSKTSFNLNDAGCNIHKSRSVKRASKLLQLFGLMPPPEMIVPKTERGLDEPIDEDYEGSTTLENEFVDNLRVEIIGEGYETASVPYNSVDSVHRSQGNDSVDLKPFSGVKYQRSLPSVARNRIADQRRKSIPEPPPFYTYIQETFTSPQIKGVTPDIGVPQTIFEDATNADGHAPADLIPDPHFKTRRRHAEKLTKFFGVTSHEISEVMATPIFEKAMMPAHQVALNTLGRSNSWSARQKQRHPQMGPYEQARESNVPVGNTDVRYDSSTSRWKRLSLQRRARPSDESDIEDILEKLRGMKAGF